MLHMASVLQGASESQQAREHSVGAVWQLRYFTREAECGLSCKERSTLSREVQEEEKLLLHRSAGQAFPTIVCPCSSLNAS